MNHFETDDGKVVVDVMKYDVAPLFPLPDGSPSSKEPPQARLFRWTFDLGGKGNTFKEEQLDDRAGEFPRFDERFCMSRLSPRLDRRRRHRRRRRTASQVTGSPTTTSRTARAPTWAAGADDRCGEPIFVPRSADAAEGDGWVLSVVYRGAEGAQRPRGVRGDRHRQGPGGARPSQQQGAGGFPRQLAAGSAYDHRPSPQQLALAAHPLDARGAGPRTTRSSATSAMPSMQAPASLRAVHPLGKSPVITDGDKTLAESAPSSNISPRPTATAASAAARHARAAALHLLPALCRRSLMPLLLHEAGVRRMPERVPWLMRPVGGQISAGADKSCSTRRSPTTSSSSKASSPSATGSPATTSPPPTSR